MDYLIEALKFMQLARAAHDPEVVKTDLEMAEWLLSQAIAERDEASGEKPRRREAGGAPESSVLREAASQVRLLSSVVPRQATITALPSFVVHR